MNLGVETLKEYDHSIDAARVSAFSDESWGGDQLLRIFFLKKVQFQHSLMNLGVETFRRQRRCGC